METTLYKIKEDLATLGAQIAQDANWIAQKAGDPKVKMDEIQEKKAHRDELPGALRHAKRAARRDGAGGQKEP